MQAHESKHIPIQDCGKRLLLRREKLRHIYYKLEGRSQEPRISEKLMMQKKKEDKDKRLQMNRPINEVSSQDPKSEDGTENTVRGIHYRRGRSISSSKERKKGDMGGN